MRYEKSFTLAKVGAVAALAVLMIAGVNTRASAGGSDTTLHRLAADYQNAASLAGGTLSGFDEISTDYPPFAGGGGGTPVYKKTLSIPYDVVFITFSAQGDAHFGSALDMSANVTDEDGHKQLCQPPAGAGHQAGDTVAGWYTLLKMPAPTTSTNCGPGTPGGDGGGGTGDCHDNTIYFSCCAQITPDTDEFFSTDDPFQQTVEIRLADQPGGNSGGQDKRAFYERATIYIDAESDPNHKLCTGVGVPSLFSCGTTGCF